MHVDPESKAAREAEAAQVPGVQPGPPAPLATDPGPQ